MSQDRSHSGEQCTVDQVHNNAKRKGKCRVVHADKNQSRTEAAARKKQLKEEKARLVEERKRKRQVRLTKLVER